MLNKDKLPSDIKNICDGLLKNTIERFNKIDHNLKQDMIYKINIDNIEEYYNKYRILCYEALLLSKKDYYNNCRELFINGTKSTAPYLMYVYFKIMYEKILDDFNLKTLSKIHEPLSKNDGKYQGWIRGNKIFIDLDEPLKARYEDIFERVNIACKNIKAKYTFD